jgi:hypothetical protein
MTTTEGATRPGGPAGDGVARPPTAEDFEMVRDLLGRSEEMEHSEDPAQTSERRDTGSAPDVPGLKILQSLMQATFFMDYFAYHAHLRYLDRFAQERVARLIFDRPLFYRVCLICDFITRLLLLLIITVTVTAVAWGFVLKTFYPDLATR